MLPRSRTSWVFLHPNHPKGIRRSQYNQLINLAPNLTTRGYSATPRPANEAPRLARKERVHPQKQVPICKLALLSPAHKRFIQNLVWTTQVALGPCTSSQQVHEGLIAIIGSIMTRRYHLSMHQLYNWTQASLLMEHHNNLLEIFIKVQCVKNLLKWKQFLSIYQSQKMVQLKIPNRIFFK